MTPDDMARIEAIVRRVLREELAAAGLVHSERPEATGRCGFCGAPRAAVRHLVSGMDHRSFICDECVLAATRALMNRTTVVAGEPPPLPAGLDDQQFVRSRDVDRHGGLVYVVATVPDLDIRRIKIGFTSRPIENRLDAFRTANPTASLLGLWSAPSDAEDIAHRLIDGRMRNTEVFHVPDVLAAITALDDELLRRWP